MLAMREWNDLLTDRPLTYHVWSNCQPPPSTNKRDHQATNCLKRWEKQNHSKRKKRDERKPYRKQTCSKSDTGHTGIEAQWIPRYCICTVCFRGSYTRSPANKKKKAKRKIKAKTQTRGSHMCHCSSVILFSSVLGAIDMIYNQRGVEDREKEETLYFAQKRRDLADKTEKKAHLRIMFNASEGNTRISRLQMTKIFIVLEIREKKRKRIKKLLTETKIRRSTTCCNSESSKTHSTEKTLLREFDCAKKRKQTEEYVCRNQRRTASAVFNDKSTALFSFRGVVSFFFSFLSLCLFAFLPSLYIILVGDQSTCSARIPEKFSELLSLWHADASWFFACPMSEVSEFLLACISGSCCMH